jgi:hypothetical protein
MSDVIADPETAPVESPPVAQINLAELVAWAGEPEEETPATSTPAAAAPAPASPGETATVTTPASPAAASAAPNAPTLASPPAANNGAHSPRRACRATSRDEGRRTGSTCVRALGHGRPAATSGST